MARQTAINSADDMRWLREVHLPRLSAKYKSAIIVGNEDYPDRIEVYERKDPRVTDVPIIFEADDEGVFKEKQAAHETRHHSTKKSPAQLQREIDEALATGQGRGRGRGRGTIGSWTQRGDDWVSEDKRFAIRGDSTGRRWFIVDLDTYDEAEAPSFIEATRAAKIMRSRRQSKGRQHSSIMTVHTLSPEQLRALRAFANANGAQWKSKLNVAWSTGRYSDYPGTEEYGDLQQVRNTFGPAWLTKFSFNKVKTHSVKR